MQQLACLRRFYHSGPTMLCRAVMLFVTFVFDAAFAISLAGFLILHVRLLQQNKVRM